MSIKFAPTGKPIHVDWLDSHERRGAGLRHRAREGGHRAGADEIQLDYVRFPVHLSSKIAVLPAKEDRSGIIRDFVKRVHAVTAESGVALSLDFFGVAATGDMNDILYLGQHIPTVAPEADAISLMSYPSHYNKGYMGFPEPGEHPEVVGIGNTAAVKQLKPTGSSTIFRTWLQAFPLRSANYGPAYVVAEAKSAESDRRRGVAHVEPGVRIQRGVERLPAAQEEELTGNNAPPAASLGHGISRRQRARDRRGRGAPPRSVWEDEHHVARLRRLSPARLGGRDQPRGP